MISAKVIYPPANEPELPPTIDGLPLRARVLHQQKPVDEHPVMAAVREHIADAVARALEELPEHMVADFGATMSHIKSYL